MAHDTYTAHATYDGEVYIEDHLGVVQGQLDKIEVDYNKGIKFLDPRGRTILEYELAKCAHGGDFDGVYYYAKLDDVTPRTS